MYLNIHMCYSPNVFNITMLRSEAFNMYAYLHKYHSKRQTIET